MGGWDRGLLVLWIFEDVWYSVFCRCARAAATAAAATATATRSSELRTRAQLRKHNDSSVTDTDADADTDTDRDTDNLHLPTHSPSYLISHLPSPIAHRILHLLTLARATRRLVVPVRPSVPAPIFLHLCWTASRRRRYRTLSCRPCCCCESQKPLPVHLPFILTFVFA
ncbi:hypothetical protein DENSPDRAFT_845861 [Dentipellis sp. KUC8613]|nr:hypothetical protein DENSPDRAFT_845861 [Dentipellis sp. KUC8613]